MGKITQLQVWIIGGILTVISAVLIYFLLIKPSGEEYAAAKTRFDQADAVAITEPAKKADLAAAQREVRQAQAAWRVYDARLMPDINISNLIGGMFQLWGEQLKVLGPKMDRFLRADKTVQVVSANIQLPAPPTDPNAVNRKVFEYNLGTVTVRGSFENILRHVERWNRFDRLVLADGLTLQGNTPALFGTYTLRCFVFTHGTDTPGAAVPQAGGGQGGAGGMMGGGMMGGGPPPGYGGYPGMGGGMSGSGPPAGMGGGPGDMGGAPMDAPGAGPGAMGPM